MAGYVNLAKDDDFEALIQLTNIMGNTNIPKDTGMYYLRQII